MENQEKNNIYKGHIFQLKHHQNYGEKYSPKTAREIAYIKQSNWARCKQHNNLLTYLSSHIDKEENDSIFKDKNGSNNYSGFFSKEALLSKQDKKKVKDLLNKTDSTIYTSVFSFASGTVANGTQAREIIQNTFDDFLKKAKLNPNNVSWFGCIHTNTDHIHAHIFFFENEKNYTKANGEITYKTTAHPKIPKEALDYYRFRVSEFIANNKIRYDYRDVMLAAFKQNNTTLSAREIIHKYSLQMDNYSALQYARLTAHNKKVVDDCIDELINSEPSLKELNDQFENNLQIVQEEFEAMNEDNNIESFKKKIKNYKKSRIENLHQRFGNDVLKVMVQDKKNKDKITNFKKEKSEKSYYANDSRLIRSKAIESRSESKKLEYEIKRLINIMSNEGWWKFEYKDIADMVKETNYEKTN